MPSVQCLYCEKRQSAPENQDRFQCNQCGSVMGVEEGLQQLILSVRCQTHQYERNENDKKGRREVKKPEPSKDGAFLVSCFTVIGLLGVLLGIALIFAFKKGG